MMGAPQFILSAAENAGICQHGNSVCLECGSTFRLGEINRRFCSDDCEERHEATRRCPCCGRRQDAVTFQPARVSPGLVCEDCACTCVECGRQHPDFDDLNDQAVCRGGCT